MRIIYHIRQSPGLSRQDVEPDLGINQGNISDQVYRVVRRRISEGEIPFGARLHIGNLAKELGISATPVREGLNRILMDGLATWAPRKGIYVIDPDAQHCVDLCKARLCLEQGMADDVVARASDAQVAELRGFALRLADDTLRPSQWRSTDFHHLYAAIPGNRVLQDLHQRVLGPLNVLFVRRGPEGTAFLRDMLLRRPRSAAPSRREMPRACGQPWPYTSAACKRPWWARAPASTGLRQGIRPLRLGAGLHVAFRHASLEGR